MIKRLWVLPFILCLWCGVAFGAATANFVPNPVFTSVDSDGHPRAGAALWTYATGTDTLKTTWTDSTKGTANTNPIILDTNGQAPVWIDSSDGAYRLKLVSAAGVTLWTYDGIKDLNAFTVSSDPLFLISHKADGTQKGYHVSSEFDDLVDAGDELGSTLPVTIVMDRNETLSDNWTPTDNIELRTNGFVISGAYTLDMGSCPKFTGSPGCFGSGLTVTGLKENRNDYFGTTGTAIETAAAATATGGILTIIPGTYEDVTIDESDITLRLSDGAIFKTSSAGLVPAIQFNGCDNLEVQGRVVVDGNKANNANAYSDTNIGYEYASLGVLDCDNLRLPDAYVYNAWHDGVCFEGLDNSSIGNIYVLDNDNRGVLFYEGCHNNVFNNTLVKGSVTSHAIRVGGSVTEDCSWNHFGILKSVDSGHVGVTFETHENNNSADQIISTGSANNGVKITDTQSVTIGKIITDDSSFSGFTIIASTEDTENINIGQILSTNDSQSTADEYAGVKLSGIGFAIKNVNIGSVIITGSGNATQDGDGFRILNSAAAGSEVSDINIGSIICKDNYGYGFNITDTSTVSNIVIGRLISLDNNQAGGAATDIRLSPNIEGLQIDSMAYSTKSLSPLTADFVKSLKYGKYGGGIDFVIAEEELDLTDNAGAGVEWDEVIPASTYGNSIVLGITCYVTEAITFSGSGANWLVGDGSDDDRWGTSGTLTAGTLMDLGDWTADTGPFIITTATDIKITPDADAFTAGKVRVTLTYYIIRNGKQ